MWVTCTPGWLAAQKGKYFWKAPYDLGWSFDYLRKASIKMNAAKEPGASRNLKSLGACWEQIVIHLLQTYWGIHQRASKRSRFHILHKYYQDCTYQNVDLMQTMICFHKDNDEFI